MRFAIQADNLSSLFFEIPLVSFYKVPILWSNKYVIAHTKRKRPGLQPVHITSKTNINNDYMCAVINKKQMLLFASWLQFIPFRDR